jgi:MYXO-CTERM domain-containing protein
MVITAAMSGQAKPGVATSIFTAPYCPKDQDSGIVDPNCLQVDATHAASQGTSMSSPMVAGVAAMLLQQDPTLTQDQVRAVLQAGAHRFRGTASYYDQSGPGELDADGALAALNEMKNPAEALPSPAHSWLSLSADYVTADGSTPMTVLLELRNADGQKRASLFDLSRLQPIASILGRPLAPQPKIVRGAAPGLFSFQVSVPRGLGGQAITLGATFDGANVVDPVTVPIATDAWTASYLAEAKGACNASGGDPGGMLGLAVVGLLALRRKKR